MSEGKVIDDVFCRIHENYINMNKMMVEEMDIASKHNGLTGNYREEMWIKFFRSIIPRKYSLAQGVMIIDSYGNVSKEVDIAVYDEQYTPYVFQYNTLKFIPIEAVVIVIECKSTGYDKEKLICWADRIESLKTSRSGISRIVKGYAIGETNETQVNTRPIKILASIKDNKNPNTLEMTKNDFGDFFDFIIQKQDNLFQVLIKNKDRGLGWWGNKLNGVEGEGDSLPILEYSNIKEPDNIEELDFDKNMKLKNTLKDLEVEGNPLLSLNLQLNQLLMLLNNPMMFPHFAYAKTFKQIAENYKKDKEKTK